MQHIGTALFTIERRPETEPVTGIAFAAQSARMAFDFTRFLVSVVHETAFTGDPITIQPRSLQHA
jgi:hypothetical protein